MRTLRIPILGQLAVLRVADVHARRLFAYVLEYGAMLARSGKSLRNPGGVAWAICNRWAAATDLSNDMRQLKVWLSNSHAMDHLTIDQIGSLLMNGSALVELYAGQGILESRVTPRQLDIARDGVSLLVGHVGEHEACERCTLVIDGRWAELAPAGSPLNAVLRDLLDCLIEAEAFPPVRRQDLQNVPVQDMTIYDFVFDDDSRVAS